MKTFGIRHFSPAGAYFVRQFLDKVKPDLVLIEGPADFDFLIDDIVSKKLVPPRYRMPLFQFFQKREFRFRNLVRTVRLRRDFL